MGHQGLRHKCPVSIIPETFTRERNENGRLPETFARPDLLYSGWVSRISEFVMAPRAYWKGYLKLSLVSCPIALFPAASEREKISFHQLNEKTGLDAVPGGEK
jgi:hypothetical protein